LAQESLFMYLARDAGAVVGRGGSKEL